MHQPLPTAFSYFDKGNMATVRDLAAVMESGLLGGMPGKPGWAFIHVPYLGRAEGQFASVQWRLVCCWARPGFRYIDTPSVDCPAVAQRKGVGA
jgi:NADH dehydrogenase FAD-containing subunit